VLTSNQLPVNTIQVMERAVARVRASEAGNLQAVSELLVHKVDLLSQAVH